MTPHVTFYYLNHQTLSRVPTSVLSSPVVVLGLRLKGWSVFPPCSHDRDVTAHSLKGDLILTLFPRTEKNLGHGEMSFGREPRNSGFIHKRTFVQAKSLRG